MESKTKVSKYAREYKKRSNGIDQRQLRVHNRTLEQKQKRANTLNKARKLDTEGMEEEVIQEEDKLKPRNKAGRSRSDPDPSFFCLVGDSWIKITWLKER